MYSLPLLFNLKTNEMYQQVNTNKQHDNNTNQLCKNLKTSFSYKDSEYQVSIQRLDLNPVHLEVTVKQPTGAGFDGPVVFKENVHTGELEFPVWSHDILFVHSLASAVYECYHNNSAMSA